MALVTSEGNRASAWSDLSSLAFVEKGKLVYWLPFLKSQLLTMHQAGRYPIHAPNSYYGSSHAIEK